MRMTMVAALAAAAVLCATAMAGAPAVVAAVPYGPRSTETLDAYPSSAPGSPVVLAIHGGGWTTGDSSEMLKPCENVQKQHFACFAPNYALAADGSRWPSQLADLEDALAWVKQNAALYNGDPSRLVVWGFSAGGQLGLELAYRSTGVESVISWSGPTDLSMMTESTGAIYALLGCSPRLCPATAADASPVSFVSTAVPTLMSHSVGDRTVNYSQSVELDGDLAAAGASHELLTCSGGAHALAMWSSTDCGYVPTLAWLEAHA